MKNLLKNKIFIVLFFFSVCLCIGKSNVFATDSAYTFEFEGNTYTLTESISEYNSIFVVDGGQHDIYLYFTNGDFYFTHESTAYPEKFHLNSSTGSFYEKWFTSSNLNQISTYTSESSKTSRSGPININRFDNVDYFIYSKQDIYEHTSQGEETLLFQGALLEEQEQVQTLILTPIVEQEETQQEMNKTLQQIITLLPIVMIIVVSCLALRKALALLFRILRQS